MTTHHCHFHYIFFTRQPFCACVCVYVFVGPTDRGAWNIVALLQRRDESCESHETKTKRNLSQNCMPFLHHHHFPRHFRLLYSSNTHPFTSLLRLSFLLPFFGFYELLRCAASTDYDVVGGGCGWMNGACITTSCL